MSAPTLEQRVVGYSPRQAYWLAKASELAYQDPGTIEATAREWGFDRVRHHQTAFAPPFPLSDTQAYTMASPTMVVTAFRGTQPVEIRDWLSDVDTPLWPGPGGIGLVHYGFAEALAAVFPSVRAAITEFRETDQAVWFTGHSLGGALAMLAAAQAQFDGRPDVAADGVYTFGQPRTCDRVLAAAYEKALAGRTFRVVNNNDIVPQVPPEPIYHHVAELRYIDASGKVRDSMPMTAKLADRARGYTADALAPGSDGVRDHYMAAYLKGLKNNLP